MPTPISPIEMMPTLASASDGAAISKCLIWENHDRGRVDADLESVSSFALLQKVDRGSREARYLEKLGVGSC